MNLDSLNSGDVPSGAMVLAAVILLLLTMRMEKFTTKLAIAGVAIALVGVAVWWHLHRH